MVWKHAGVAGALCLVLAACTPLGLNTASANIKNQAPATPPVLAAFEGDPIVRTAEEWTNRRAPLLRKAFEREVYGPVPVELKAIEVGRRMVDENFAGGAGTLEEIDVRVGEGPDAASFRIALAMPKGASAAAKVPLIVNENFCGNAGTMDEPALEAGFCNNHGTMAAMIRLIFGEYIITGPNADILKRGYAYATLYAESFAADDKEAAPAQLEKLGRILPAGRAPTGVIAVWAAAYSWSLDVLEADQRIDAKRTAVWGHSRQGKAALLAAAFDTRIEAAIPLQAGKGGGTLTRAYAGETVKQITRGYPHWFAPAYAAYSDREKDVPIDQHQLIALVAPRPVMLGNGWKDVWSDPNGSFRAALGADPVYELMGKRGLAQTGLKDKKELGEIEFFIRSGGHGVRVKDWDEMLDFLDRWMGHEPLVAPGANVVAAP
jgi:hypothetical protein